MTSPPATWPLSAVATELLLTAPVPRGRALSLTLKELVVCGTWRLRSRTEPGRLWGSRQVPRLAPGDAPAPDRPPTLLLHRQLTRLAPQEVPLAQVVAALQSDSSLAAQLLDQARADLVRRGLLRQEQRFLRTVHVRTPSGDAWCGGLAAQRHAWRQALQAGGARADTALAELALAPGLVPLLDATMLRDVDRAVRRRPADGDNGSGGADSGHGDGAHGAGSVRWSEVCDVDGGRGFGGLDDAFGSVDGSSGFDSSGDSGGGGDGGGGGD